MLLEISVVLLLTLLNGLLAMSELAIVSSRPVRLRILQEQGARGAAPALALAQDPGRFLSTVQIGITLVGILSGAFSGATLGTRLAAWLDTQGVSAAAADAIGVGAVVVGITYLSLIVGELVPKQIALRDPERIATRVAPAMALLSRVASPLVWLLDNSGDLVLALLGQRGEPTDKVTEEEVRTVIAEATSAGILERQEREMISGVMRLADRTARALMTPRREVEFLDAADSPDEIRRQLVATRRTRLPVRDGEPDAIVGVVNVKDLLVALAEGRRADVRATMAPAPIVLDSTDALDVLRAIRNSTVHMALVFDEYGHFEGVVTSGDILEAITGTFRDETGEEPALVERADGSFLVAGWMPIDELIDHTHVPVKTSPNYETVAGYLLHALGRLPKVGETYEVGAWRFEVVDMDGNRIDKILLARRPDA